MNRGNRETFLSSFIVLPNAVITVFRWCWWRSFKESEGEGGKREKRKEM